MDLKDQPLDSQAKEGQTLTRRSLLQGVGCLIAAAALPMQRLSAAEGEAPPAAPAKPAAPKAPPGPPVMPKLSAYMSEAGDRELPAEITELTKHHILDTLAAMVSGTTLLPGEVAVRFAGAHSGEKVATIVGSNIVCGPVEAALTNAMLAHSDETDDSHAPSHSHPGAGIVPAALAAAEQFGIDGTRFMRSVALGYDIGTRVPMTLGKAYLSYSNHRSTHQLCSNFGAAAAAACAARLSAKQMCWVLDYAVEQAAGTTAWQRDTQHIQKSLCFAGFGARNGITAALLISSGATGVDDIFSGEDNFFQAFAPEAKPEGLINKLGERYEVKRTNIKRWTVGSPIQSPLDALAAMLKKRPINPDDVKKVDVRVDTVSAGIVNNREMPDICMQHMVAVMLLDGTASFKAAHDVARMKDPAVLKMREKIELIPDPELNKLYPKRVGVVEVTLNDGTTLTERVEDVRGTTENPMPRDEVVAKAQDLMADVLGADKTKRLIDAILDLENVKDVRTLRPLLQRG